MSATKKSGKPGGKAGGGSWAETMKAALAKKRPAAGPAQARPRDSVVQKVKKDAF